MENFDLLLQSIQQNKLKKLALSSVDNLNNDEMMLLADALMENTSIKQITIVYDQYINNLADGILFKVILKKIDSNVLEELALILNLSYDNTFLLAKSLRDNTSLVKLVLADGIMCKSMPLIAESLLYNKTLLHLYLDSNFAKDESVEHLCEMLRKNCTLQSLSLQDNHFSDESIKLLVHTARYFNQSLIKLNLNNNPGSHVLINNYFCLQYSFKHGLFKREDQYPHPKFTQQKLNRDEQFNDTKVNKLF